MQWTESDIEDFAERNIRRIVGDPGARIAARQFTLPSGKRPDLLAFGRDHAGDVTLTVVELKVVRSSLSELAQLVGYMRELERSVGFTNVVVRGVLCAPDFNDDLFAIVGMMDRVALSRVYVHADFDEVAEYEFSSDPLPCYRATLNDAVQEFSKEYSTQIRTERAWRPWRRQTALVPLEHTPVAVTYGKNGNGR